MNIKLLAVIAIAMPLFTVACSKKEAPAEQNAAEQAPADAQVTPEQQAAIDSVDKPNPEAIKVEDETSTTGTETATETDTVAAQPDTEAQKASQ